mmetsp:Transcript_21564/g.56011  ORF Transcript_21564/g.56011 Transcript_21564/m.56011 type:complete len:109 (-) Transcript_21564:167-493(-)
MSFVTNEKARNYLKTMKPKPRKNFAQMFPNASPLALRLLQRMLVFDPRERCTVDEALDHPYLAALHDPDDEPASHTAFDFDWEKDEHLDEHMYRRLVADEIRFYCPDT